MQPTTGYVALERNGGLWVSRVTCTVKGDLLAITESEALLGQNVARGLIAPSELHPTLRQALEALEKSLEREVRICTDMAAQFQRKLEIARSLKRD